MPLEFQCTPFHSCYINSNAVVSPQPDCEPKSDSVLKVEKTNTFSEGIRQTDTIGRDLTLQPAYENNFINPETYPILTFLLEAYSNRILPCDEKGESHTGWEIRGNVWGQRRDKRIETAFTGQRLCSKK